jgi:NADPH-dependent glutamate synthase beta subunit-like oxidoreductase
MGVKIVCNHRTDDVLAEQATGKFDAVFLGIGAQLANHLEIPAMDGGKMIDAISLLERVEKGRAPTLGRVVSIVGGGNTAMDAARIAKRLGAEEAVLLFRFDKEHMEAHPTRRRRPLPKE